jgi:hypothetical protein
MHDSRLDDVDVSVTLEDNVCAERCISQPAANSQEVVQFLHRVAEYARPQHHLLDGT